MDLHGWYKLRWKILERDQYTCQYCGQSAPNVRLEVDHRLSLADGGTNDDSNLVTACWACNMGKDGLRQSIVLKRQRADKARQGSFEKPRQTEILNLIKAHSGLTNKEITASIGISPHTINTTLSRLKKKGFLVKRDGLWFATTS
jgi:DNA-binding CsgD family transcriptional regulator